MYIIDENGNFVLLLFTCIFSYRNNHADKCKLENLYIRNYPRVTNVFLRNAAKTCPFMQFLDVTGTSCTTDEIGRFKAQRPNVSIVC